ncbi:MAG: transglutaminase [Candidatus Nitrohelix vancouverensis]|uniref:Transglutaminase n=1 Tax=Candidatus Nitrohelix vancouverensis TaxID=2705534 RepID=A0A7T0C0B0_9BACT|nr:MAG: transglutaminase [Candidatus Nitrohelix vancouverensis]
MYGEILALNFDCMGSPSITLKDGDHSKAMKIPGWGFGWYPNDDYGASIVKDAMAKDSQTLLNALQDGARFRSTNFMCKIKGAGKQYTQHDTQPFRRSFGGYDWLFLHNGQLDYEALSEMYSDPSGLLEPVGKTDSELAFCFLLGQFMAASSKGLADINGAILLAWLERLDALGSADFVISDGRSMAIYHGKNSKRDLFYHRALPSEKLPLFESELVSLNLEDPRDSLRTVFMVTSFQFEDSEFQAMEPGRLLIVRRGAIYWDSLPEGALPYVASPSAVVEEPVSANAQEEEKAPERFVSQQQEQSQAGAGMMTADDLSEMSHFLNTINIKSVTHDMDGAPLNYRYYDISHLTDYKYSTPVEHSSHTFRLQPVEDSIQEVVQATLGLSVDGELLQFEDVFNNQSIYYDITNPYKQLQIKMKSRVKVYACPPDDHRPTMRRSQIPLVWMPWQRQMMLPYLLPPELPETQLRQLTDYAMSFVQRNDGHLVDSLVDINKKIFQDFSYVQGSTVLETTAFDVFSTRQGVCQDFANLFICLCRLLNIPARYRVGYIYTGGAYENKLQSDASHAWAEIYLPFLGWRGFDPTNGCMVQQDHIRVASGRNYLDATPVSGTIFKGGGNEKLRVEVRIEEVSD